MSSPLIRGATVAVLATLLFSGATEVAGASEDWGINGTFAAISNGELAKTNEVFRDEAVTRSTWTITTTCSSSITCSGTVSSDQGWTAPIYTKTGMWYVRRTIPGWEPCPDGTTADGFQVIRFYGVSADFTQDRMSPNLFGEDLTTGPSGACGRNQSLEIRMPFELNQIS